MRLFATRDHRQPGAWRTAPMPSTSHHIRRSVMTRAGRGAKRLLLETPGWVLLFVGLAAIPLPGPGLLMTFAGLMLLSRQYAWAHRRVDTVRVRALQGAAHSVASWPRIAGSFTVAASLLPAGVAWIVSPPAPGWWPLSEAWWLPGGAVVGASQLASAVIALALLGYSYRRFRGTSASPNTSTGAIRGVIAGAGPPTPTGSSVSHGACRTSQLCEGSAP